MGDSSKLQFEEQGKLVWLFVDAKYRRNVEKSRRNPQAVDIDFDNEDDVWFMEAHQQLRKEEEVGKEVLKEEIREEVVKEEVSKELKVSREVKKKVCQKKGLKPVSKVLKKNRSKTECSKSEKSVKIEKILKIPPPPCMFSTRIQRAWQQKSKKHWYDLTAQSRKRAEKEMRELSSSLQGRRNANKPNTTIKPFRLWEP